MVRSDVVPLAASNLKSEPVEDASALVLQHYDAEHLGLRRYLLLMGLDQATVEEMVQDTFLKLHRHLLSGSDRSNVRAWLYRVAHNLALNEHKSARRKRTESIEKNADEGMFASSHRTPEQQLLEDERDLQLRNALAQLSGPQRECLLLRSQGMKYREIAEVAGISIASVGENVQRGLEKLKGLL